MSKVSSQQYNEYQMMSRRVPQKFLPTAEHRKITKTHLSVFSKYNLDSCVGQQCADEVQQYLQDFLWLLEGWKDAETVNLAKQCTNNHQRHVLKGQFIM